MGNLKVVVTDVDGVVQVMENVSPGESLMELARANSVAGVAGDCGGACACATCHVYVDGAWFEKVGPADDIELSMLEMVADVQKPNSRLSCQIKVTPELDGVEVTVAPPSDY